MGGISVRAKVVGGKIVPLQPLDLPEGKVIQIKIDVSEENREKFLDALKKLKGSIGGEVNREEWYAQAYLYRL